MTEHDHKRVQDFLAKLVALLRNSGSTVEEYQVGPDGSLARVNPEREENSSLLIHDALDMKLVAALDRWMVSQNITHGQVHSCLAFSLAQEIFYNTDNEDQACAITQSYETYIHQTVHLLYKHYKHHKKPKK